MAFLYIRRYFRVEKHGKKFTVFKSGDKEWMFFLVLINNVCSINNFLKVKVSMIGGEPSKLGYDK